MKSKLEPFKNEIIKLYIEQELTCKQIGKRFNLRPSPVSRFLTKNNVKLRKGGLKKGSSSTTKGKKFTEKTFKHTVDLIESGKYKNFSDACIRKHVRKYLIAKHGHKCQLCGLSEWGGYVIPLVCDHIDGSAKNCNLKNFRIICNNCDAILPTYKSKNRGKGRKLG
jgi:hypothetical protein